MKYVVRALLLLVLVVYSISFVPSAVEGEAESDFHNIVGIDTDIDTKVFSGPVKLDYNDYKWSYVFPEHDTAFVYIHVTPFPLGFNKITYSFSDSTRDFDDLPGRESYKKLINKEKGSSANQNE